MAVLLLALVDGRVCPSIKARWEGFMAEFTEVFNLPNTTKLEKQVRREALSNLKLPERLLTTDFCECNFI